MSAQLIAGMMRCSRPLYGARLDVVNAVEVWSAGALATWQRPPIPAGPMAWRRAAPPGLDAIRAREIAPAGTLQSLLNHSHHYYNGIMG
jgi:hypothetical protein